jgi:ABC-type nitrate/sulfonate/bicarbonate transport system ATPase subunit
VTVPEAPALGKPIVQIRDLSLTYPGGIRALDGCDITLTSGEFVVLLGPSGCGKSTLLQILAGLLKPTVGEVRVGDRVNPPPGKDRGVVFQHAGLLPWFDVHTNIEIGLRAQGMSRAEARRLSDEQIRRMGLEGFGSKFPHQLSGGMQQRVGVARAFAIDPPILLMDEPFGALDAQTRVLLQEEMIRLWEGSGKTVLFVTHSIEEAIFLADRILVMTARPGQIRESLPVRLPRPRGERTRYDPEYLELHERLWAMIRGDAERAILAEAGSDRGADRGTDRGPTGEA